MEFWLIFAAVCGIAEALTPGSLISIWFCFGAVFAAIVSLVTPSFLIQASAFAIASLASLLSVRKLISARLLPKPQATNSDRYIGTRVRLAESILNDQPGVIRLNGTDWSAVSSTGLPIEKGSEVIIERISGVKLVVRKLKENHHGNSAESERTAHALASVGGADRNRIQRH